MSVEAEAGAAPPGAGGSSSSSSSGKTPGEGASAALDTTASGNSSPPPTRLPDTTSSAAPAADDDDEKRELTEEEKVARKRAKKARQQAAKEQKKQDRVAEREKEMAGFVPLAKKEQERMDRQLKKEGMQIYDIPSDGNCLFRAIEHQLKFNEHPRVQTDRLDHYKLRMLCADVLDKNREEYMLYMPEDEPDFDAYLRKIRDHLWGGDMELNALSRELEVKIRVYQGEGEQVLTFGGDLRKPEAELRITFHKYLYACAHYNSLLPL